MCTELLVDVVQVTGPARARKGHFALVIRRYHLRACVYSALGKFLLVCQEQPGGDSVPGEQGINLQLEFPLCRRRHGGIQELFSPGWQLPAAIMPRHFTGEMH